MLLNVPPTIRNGCETDYDQLGQVMFHAIRNSRSDYTTEQRAAWAPVVKRGADWSKRLSGQMILVAETDREIVGFLSLAASGYIDLAFISPIYQGTGLFRRLYERIEATARAQGEQRLWVHASLMAQPAFAAMGFQIVEEQFVELSGQTLRRFEMQKYMEASR